MNYEEKYKHALENFKKIKSANSGNKELVNFIEYEYPELRESEDEKIIRTLKEIVNLGCAKNISVENNVELKDCLAWLEKQGEQKPTPKFKIGDTIHKIGENTVFPRTIEKIEDGDYVCNNSHSFVNIKFQDDYELVEQKPAWSDEDEHCIELLLPIIDSSSLIPKNRKKCKEFLKSLKPNHWKPSEFQLKCLKKVIPHDNTERGCELEDVLTELYDNLKKL